MTGRPMSSGRRLEALMDAMEGTPLTPAQRYVVLCLARHADHKTGLHAFPGTRTLAADAQCKRETVSRALKLAEELGIIAAEHRGHGRVTSWTILPELAPESGHRVAPGSDHHWPPSGPGVVRNGATTTGTTENSGPSPTGQASPETQPSHHGPEGEGSDQRKGIGKRETAFAERLLRSTVGMNPTPGERQALEEFAFVAVQNDVTPDDVLAVVQGATPALMRANAGVIVRDALKHRHRREFPEAAW